MQPPQRRGRLQVLEHNRANAGLGTRCPYQRRHAIDGISFAVARNRRAERVVAVKAAPAIDVELRALPRTECRAAFRAHQPGCGRSTVDWIHGVHAVAGAVDPGTCQRPEPWGPFDFVLRIRAGACHEGRGQRARFEPPRLLGVIEGHLGDAVVANLQPDRVLHHAAVPAGQETMGHLESRDEPIVHLLHLIAVRRIVEIEREVENEIEVVPKPVRPYLGQRPAAALLPLTRQAVPARGASVGRIDGPEAIDQP
jgi:hypothetical protein